MVSVGGKKKRQCSYVPLCFGGSSFPDFGGDFLEIVGTVFKDCIVVPTGVHEARGLCFLRENISPLFSSVY